jgi:hypothetical protein
MKGPTKLHKLATGAMAIVALIAIGTATGCSTTSSTSSATPSPSSPGTSGNEPSKNASESNTPSVGPSGSVEVDDLRWRLDHASTATTIGEPSSGLGAKANGIFVVVTLHVTNKKSESVTLTSGAISLVAGKKTYSTDSSAETALVGQGGKTFLIETLGPGVSLTGKTGFDVAPSVLHQHPQLRFNELGIGTTHGYIALPPLSGE